MLGMSYSCWRVMPPCRNTGGQFLKSVTLQCYKSVSNCFIAPLWFKSCRYQNIYQPLIYSQSSRISWTLIPASGENEGCVRWGDDLFRSLLHSDFGYHVYIFLHYWMRCTDKVLSSNWLLARVFLSGSLRNACHSNDMIFPVGNVYKIWNVI